MIDTKIILKADENVSVFTVCNVAYLNKAMVLAESLYLSNKIKLDIFIFDKKRELYLTQEYCNFHWVEEMGIPNFKKLSFKYNIIELSTAFKPWIALNLLKSNSKVIFFDPDVMVFHNVNSILEGLDKHPVILTPHYFCPKINGLIDDARMMKFGVFNLGFFAVNSTIESDAFLNWWSDRCLLNGFDDAQFGIFTDQKWVSIAPCFFSFLHTTYDPGFNVAYWNIDERTISKNGSENYYVNEIFPLVFFHFSSFDAELPEKLSKNKFLMGNNNKLISEIAILYKTKLNQYEQIAQYIDYSFDYMSDGRYISPTLRRAYASILDQFPDNHDPFDCNGVVSKFAKKNYLFQKDNKKYNIKGYSSVERNSFGLDMLFWLLRLLLRIVGPNNFMNISRLFIYLSGYNRNSKMWKL
jgi:hypothetical protein